jgi:hypothetical protein
LTNARQKKTLIASPMAIDAKYKTGEIPDITLIKPPIHPY